MLALKKCIEALNNQATYVPYQVRLRPAWKSRWLLASRHQPPSHTVQVRFRPAWKEDKPPTLQAPPHPPHPRTPTPVYTRTHPYTPVYTRIHPHTPAYTRTHPYTPVHTRIHPHTPAHTRTHTYLPDSHADACAAFLAGKGPLPLLPNTALHTHPAYPAAAAAAAAAVGALLGQVRLSYH